MKKVAQLSAVLACLAGCCSTSPQNEGSPASVEQVVRAIKEDLKQYQLYVAATRNDAALPNECGGKIQYDVSNVKVALTTQSDDKATGTASLTLPVGTGTFGPSFGVSKETKGTQTLTFMLYPNPNPAPALEPSGRRTDTIDAGRYPIAAALRNLRESLLLASNTAPCFSLKDLNGKSGETSSSFSFGFTVINDKTTGGSLKFVLFSLGVTSDSQRQWGNQITVNFTATGDAAAGFY